SFLDAIDGCLRISIFEHHYLSQDLFSLSVGGNGTKSVGMSKSYRRHIADVHGVSVSGLDDNVFDIFQAFHQSLAAHEITLVGLFDIASTGNIIIRLKSLVNVCQVY